MVTPDHERSTLSQSDDTADQSPSATQDVQPETPKPKRGTGRRLHGAIAYKLGTDIVSGVYAPGTVLSSEVEFSEALDVSRGAFREAMQVLAAKGLVESRPKAGTRVLPAPAGTCSTRMSSPGPSPASPTPPSCAAFSSCAPSSSPAPPASPPSAATARTCAP
jgi:DNA-binding transcriptional MocR family regulator